MLVAAALLGALGTASLIVGAALIYWPAALLVAGLAAIAAARHLIALAASDARRRRVTS